MKKKTAQKRSYAVLAPFSSLVTCQKNSIKRGVLSSKRTAFLLPLFFTLLLIFGTLLSVTNAAPVSAATAATLLDDPCPSGVIFEDSSGVECVSQFSPSDANTLQQLSLTFDFKEDSILHVGQFYPDPFPHQQLTWQKQDIPYNFNPLQTAACSDTNTVCCSNQAATCIAGNIGLYEATGISAYGGNCAANKGCSATTVATQPNPLTCQMENIHFKDPTNSSMDGKYEHVVYCDREISTICTNVNQLRAQYLGSGNSIYESTDRLNTTADATGDTLTFSCARSSQAPVLMNLPTQGNCDLNYIGGSNDTNGYCDWTPGNGGALTAPSGVINCSQAAYRGNHPSECACTFDTAHKVGNGNTYTAIGCIPSNVGGIMNIFLTVAIAFASIFALIRMMVGGYEIMTNPAGPEEIGEGRDIIVNAALGLLFVTLCVVILRIIGVQVLQLNVIKNIFSP